MAGARASSRRKAASASAVLLVDRADVVERLARCAPRSVAIVGIDGRPASTIVRLRRSIRAGHRPAVLYLHDAATVLYPFAIEPLATMVEMGALSAGLYVDLGLPPLGAAARRFRDATMPRDELVFTLDAIPTDALWRYCESAIADALSAARGA